jgi:hypothetical protein
LLICCVVSVFYSPILSFKFEGYNKGLLEGTNVNQDFRNNTVNNVNQLIENEEYHCRSKNGFPGVFSRVRKLCIKSVIVFICRGFKSSLQRDLDSISKELIAGDFNIRSVTKGAFTQARAKLKHEAFIELSDNVTQTFYNEAPYLVWHQMRLLAVDGSTLTLPQHESITDEFGEHAFGPNADNEKSIARTSLLYDVLNLVTLDAQIGKFTTSERALFSAHLDKLCAGDLVLLDRGYPSIEFFFQLAARKIEFCVRMKIDWWLEVKNFSESNDKERIVSFKLPNKDRDKLKDYPEIQDKEIKCRLISVILPSGEKEILCTSLLDSDKIPHEEFCELYHYRWNIEEAYKLFKTRAEMEKFSGKTALSVKQDYFAKIFLMNLCAVLSFPIEEKVKKESKEAKEKNKKKHTYKINRTSALSMTQSITIAMFLKGMRQKAIEAFDDIVMKTLEIVRPGRNNPRIKKPKRPYHMNYKPL